MQHIFKCKIKKEWRFQALLGYSNYINPLCIAHDVETFGEAGPAVIQGTRRVVHGPAHLSDNIVVAIFDVKSLSNS